MRKTEAGTRGCTQGFFRSGICGKLGTEKSMIVGVSQVMGWDAMAAYPWNNSKILFLPRLLAGQNCCQYHEKCNTSK